MTISYYGHSCWRLESKNVSLLIDPFSKEIGLRPPKIKDDIVLVTHDHYDHNNIEGMPEGAFLIRGPGEYEVKGVYVRGIRSYHDKSQGKERGPNTIYVITMEEMNLCHLGDFGEEKLSEDQVSAIAEIDVLFIPVGGTYTVNYKEAVGVISQIEPKVAVPMHYKIPGLKLEIDGPEKFLKEIGLAAEKTENQYRIQKKNLPAEGMKVIMIQI